MFSSDLSGDQLKMKLGHMSNTPSLVLNLFPSRFGEFVPNINEKTKLTNCLQVIFCMADEYVPEYVDKKALVERCISH